MTLLPQSFLARLLGLLVLLTVPWLVLVGHELLERHQQARADGLASVRQRSQVLAREVDDTLQRNRRLLDFLALRPEVMQADADACGRLLSGLVGIDPVLSNAALLDTEGQLVCASRANAAPTGFKHDAEFQAALNSRTLMVGGPRWGTVAQRPVLALARSVQGADGRTVGVVLLALDLQAWSRTWARHATEPGSTLVVQNERGLIVARHPDPAQWIGHDARERYDTFMRREHGGQGPGEGVDLATMHVSATTPSCAASMVARARARAWTASRACMPPSRCLGGAGGRWRASRRPW